LIEDVKRETSKNAEHRRQKEKRIQEAGDRRQKEKQRFSLSFSILSSVF
jgi:hypothetical protein